MKKKLLAVLLLLLAAALTGCAGSGNGDEVNLAQVMSDIESQAELDDSMIDITAEELRSFYGIAGSEITQFTGKMTGIGTSADEILMLEAANGKADAVKQKVEARYQAKLDQMKDYLPGEYDKIAACEVLVRGNYIAMFISADAEKMIETFNSAF